MKGKQKGNVAELKFIAEAANLGYTVCLPFGDNNRFDIVLYSNKFIRIQIKSGVICKKRKNSWRVETRSFNRKTKKKYTKEQIDYAVIFIHETADFYIVPVEVFNKVTGIRFNPHSTKEKMHNYKNNWNILKEGDL